jgi:hypothetical protein
MPKAFETWTVLPHGPIEKLEKNLWRVEGNLPRNPPLRRVMTVVRLTDGRLVLHNPIALDDAEMKELERFGTPGFLIIPNGSHRLDAKIFKDRYPKATVIAPAGARRKVEEVVKVDATEGNFGDDTATYRSLEGTADREGYLLVRSGTTVTLVLNDVIMNVRKGRGFSSFVMSLLGFFGDEPKVIPFARRLVIEDGKLARTHLERLADTPNLARVILAHGAMLTDHPGDAIRKVASTHLPPSS